MIRLLVLATIGCVAILYGGGCGTPPALAPVPVEGTRTDLAAIAGEWSGSYWSDSVPRHGTLTFQLRPGADTAYGEIEMTFAAGLRLYGESAEAPLRRSPCTTLDIAVVRLAGNTVRGTLAPYWDPDCDCRTHTVFEGELTGDSIAGTFSSRREAANVPLLTGRWLVVRE